MSKGFQPSGFGKGFQRLAPSPTPPSGGGTQASHVDTMGGLSGLAHDNFGDKPILIAAILKVGRGKGGAISLTGVGKMLNERGTETKADRARRSKRMENRLSTMKRIGSAARARHGVGG